MSKMNRNTKVRNALLDTTITNNEGQAIKLGHIVNELTLQTLQYGDEVTHTQEVARLMSMRHTTLVRRLKRQDVEILGPTSIVVNGRRSRTYAVDTVSVIAALCVGNYDMCERLYRMFKESMKAVDAINATNIEGLTF